jgi:WD40 repeat protein
VIRKTPHVVTLVTILPPSSHTQTHKQGDDFFLGLLLWDSESSRVISNSHDNSLYLYSCSTGEALQTITGDEGGGHRAKVRDMKRNGDTVTTAGWDGWVKIWVLM